MLTKNVLARAHKKFQRGRHSEIYLLTLKKQDKTKMELPLDMVSLSVSSCRTKFAYRLMTFGILSIFRQRETFWKWIYIVKLYSFLVRICKIRA